jgi:hypothetical protein
VGTELDGTRHLEYRIDAGRAAEHECVIRYGAGALRDASFELTLARYKSDVLHARLGVGTLGSRRFSVRYRDEIHSRHDVHKLASDASGHESGADHGDANRLALCLSFLKCAVYKYHCMVPSTLDYSEIRR